MSEAMDTKMDMTLRVLHTADWHLGHTLHGLPRAREHAAFLAWLLLIRKGTGDTGLDLGFMPALNASLNSLAAVLLATGFVAIRRGSVRVHKFCMVSAFVASTLFLVCYIVYHYVHGDTKFTGVGALRAIYFLILITHVLLAMTIIPMALTAFYFAFKRAFVRHKKVTRILLPIWLYVSVTGVVVFFMLRGSPTAVP